MNDIIKNLMGKIDTNKFQTTNYTAQNIYDKTLENMENQYKAKDDCPNLELCNNLKISHDNICTKGSDTRSMCSFGESRIILLLSRLNFN